MRSGRSEGEQVEQRRAFGGEVVGEVGQERVEIDPAASGGLEIWAGEDRAQHDGASAIGEQGGAAGTDVVFDAAPDIMGDEQHGRGRGDAGRRARCGPCGGGRGRGRGRPGRRR